MTTTTGTPLGLSLWHDPCPHDPLKLSISYDCHQRPPAQLSPWCDRHRRALPGLSYQSDILGDHHGWIVIRGAPGMEEPRGWRASGLGGVAPPRATSPWREGFEPRSRPPRRPQRENRADAISRGRLPAALTQRSDPLCGASAFRPGTPQGICRHKVPRPPPAAFTQSPRDCRRLSATRPDACRGPSRSLMAPCAAGLWPSFRSRRAARGLLRWWGQIRPRRRRFLGPR